MILGSAILAYAHFSDGAKKLSKGGCGEPTSLTRQATVAQEDIPVGAQPEPAVEDVAQVAKQESSKAKIIGVDNWDLISEAILRAPSHSCIIFDVDGVILSEREGQRRNLVDIAILNVVALIKHKNFKAYALTHGGWGPYRGMLCEERRMNDLRRLGIDFLYLSQFEGYLEIPYATSSPASVLKQSVKTALIKDGIIFSRDRLGTPLPKGEIFFKVLEKLNERPTHIIFIDDIIDNLICMERECALRHIPFQGFLYLDDYPK